MENCTKLDSPEGRADGKDPAAFMEGSEHSGGRSGFGIMSV